MALFLLASAGATKPYSDGHKEATSRYCSKFRAGNVWGFDASANGDVYVDHISRPLEILSMKSDGSAAQVLSHRTAL
jgi:hypothetical protein